MTSIHDNTPTENKEITRLRNLSGNLSESNTKLRAAAEKKDGIIAELEHEVSERRERLVAANERITELEDGQTYPEPSDPEPSDPEPSDPEPSDPEPSDPEPSDPEPSDPEPSDAEVAAKIEQRNPTEAELDENAGGAENTPQL